MQFKFSRSALCFTLMLLALLALLATMGAGLGWIRSFIGDVIAVIFVYAVLRTFIDGNRLLLALIAFLTGVAVEYGQYFAKQFDIVIGNPALRIILGATPDWLDVLAYSIGAGIVVVYLLARRQVKASN
ncbi:ribosomal maturation YjgA family protein [Brucella anthropi]